MNCFWNGVRQSEKINLPLIHMLLVIEIPIKVVKVLHDFWTSRCKVLLT